MRLRLQLTPLSGRINISLNYSYYLSTAIYRWIEVSSKDYSAFLHDSGFRVDNSVKRFKHFCFSQLIVPRRRISNGRLEILSPSVEWYIAMPVEASLQHLVVGMFEKREFFIEREENRFVVEQVETIPEPKWERRMVFRMLSPTTVSTMHERNGRLLPEYLLPSDPRLVDLLRQNILHKYRSLHCRSECHSDLQGNSARTITSDGLPATFGSGRQAGQSDQLADTDFRCTLDDEFITNRGGPEKITKLITVKEGREDETRVRGFMCPVTIEGNLALTALAYESGLGEKNSLGFGMLEVV